MSLVDVLCFLQIGFWDEILRAPFSRAEPRRERLAAPLPSAAWVDEMPLER